MRSQERRHSTLSHRACQSTGTKSDVVCVILMMKMVATMMMMAQWMDAQRQTVYRSSAAQRSSGNSTGNTSCIVCQFVRSLRQSRQIQSSMQLQPGGKPQEGNTCKISQYMQAVRSSQRHVLSRVLRRRRNSTTHKCTPHELHPQHVPGSHPLIRGHPQPPSPPCPPRRGVPAPSWPCG